MHFHQGEIRGGRVVSVFQQPLIISKGVKTAAQISGPEIHGTVGRSRGEGSAVSFGRTKKNSSKRRSRMERKSALVVFTWPS
jgi:hypothetical protein